MRGSPEADEDPRDRDDPHRGAAEPALGRGAHRRGHHRARRDLLSVAHGRGIPPRICRAARHRPRSRCRSTCCRPISSAISASARPASRCAAIRHSTSRSGTFSARRQASRSRSCSAAFPGSRSAPTTPAPAREYIKDDKGQTTANYGLDAKQELRRPQRLPASRRRTRRGAAGGGHHGHEDLAVRPCGGEDARPRHFRRRPEGGAGAVRKDPQGGRRQDGHHGRVPLDVAAAAGDQDRQRRWSPTPPTGTRIRSAWTASPT